MNRYVINIGILFVFMSSWVVVITYNKKLSCFCVTGDLIFGT